MYVIIIFKKRSPYKGAKETFDNVNEVHWTYSSIIGQLRVAIEPYGTYEVKHIQELIVYPVETDEEEVE